MKNTHSVLMGYILWIFGFLGAHRFYYGKKATGTLWFFTGGLFLVGWIIDIFLIPSMDREAERRYADGPYDYNISWVLLTFLGAFGVQHFYLGKWLRGVVYLLSLGLFGVGVLYDFFTLNETVSERNRESISGRSAVAYT